MDPIGFPGAFIAAVGILAIVIGVLRRPLSTTPLSAPMLAFGIGVLLGPIGFGAFSGRHWTAQMPYFREFARFTLAVGLMGVALRIPRGYIRTHWQPLAWLLGPMMTITWLISSGVALLVPGISALAALVIGAAITPTDPVLASTIVSGRLARDELPFRLRSLISVESGLNDGLGLLFLYLPLLLLDHATADALGHWLTQVLLYEVLGGVALGLGLGWIAGKALVWSERHRAIERDWYLAFSIALSLAVIGLAHVAHVDGLLAVFISGRAMVGIVNVHDRHWEESVQEAANHFAVLPMFMLLGILAPWSGWGALGWSGALVVAGALVLRRLPLVVIFMKSVAPLKRLDDALFVGWFGPIGIAAVFYATLAAPQLNEPRIWHVVSLCVVASLLAHGATAGPFTVSYARSASHRRSTGE